MIRPRKSVELLQKYRPPLEGRGGKLRLDFNENTVGCAPEVARALRRIARREWLSRYPEYEEGRRILAGYFKVTPQELLLANGTDDAIKMICDAFVDPGDALLIPVPSFPVYEFFHSVAGGATVRIPCGEQFRPPVEEIIGALKKRKIRWLALANPNNPTGTQIAKRDLRAILTVAPQTVVLVDEAYYDFSGETVLPWIRKFPNLIVTRTFSKAFGLAALRMGFLMTNAALAAVIHRAQNPFAVNALALACACAAIREEKFVRGYAEQIRSNRAVLCRKLDALDVAYIPSAANFVLARVGDRAPEIAQRLRDKDILIRDWSHDPNLRGHVRLTVGSRAQTRRLVRELARLCDLIEPRQASKGQRNLAAYSTTGWFA
jgi:histidinol-phosphate aminotransferase